VFDLSKPESAALFDRSGVTPRIVQSPLWPLLLPWALFVLLLDIGTRRIAWDRFVSREFGVDLAKAASEAVAERGTAAVRAAGKLRERPRVEPPAPASARLSEADAAKLVEAERERRRKERLQALRDLRESQQGTGESSEDAGTRAPTQAKAAKQQPQDPRGGDLLAAKRRARERFSDGVDGTEETP